jgi:RNA-directed DNA polymerase
VTNLRQRIFRATQQQEWQKVRDLQKLLLRSHANVVLSVRQVTQVNAGRRTPGVDGQVVDTASQRMRLVRQLQANPVHRARPVRRVYIPKSDGSSRLRPLGIPTIADRVRQHGVKTALEPSWEARFESCSYGFRPGRSTHDAIEHLFRLLRATLPNEWVLDADIRGAYDHINHSFLLRQLEHFPARRQIEQWLKAGYLEYGTLHATDEGAPQGAICSPVLANIALDGLGAVLQRLWGAGCVVRWESWYQLAGESPAWPKSSRQASRESCGRRGNAGSEA